MLNQPADARINGLPERDRKILADIPDACDALVGAEAADANESTSLPAGEWTIHVYCVLAGSAYAIDKIGSLAETSPMYDGDAAYACARRVLCACPTYQFVGDMTFLLCMEVLSMHD